MDECFNCVICKNNINREGIKCSENHFHCKECFQTYVKYCSNSLVANDLNYKQDDEIYCTMKTEANGENCCKSCQFSPFQIAQCVDSDTFEEYLEMKISASNNKLEKELLRKHQKEILDLKKIANSEENEKINRIILQKQLLNEFPNAVQCKRCKFGPIEIYGCWDLSTHHNEVSRKGTINNSCPRCGWFTRERKDWEKWNGILADNNSYQTHNIQSDNLTSGNNLNLLGCFLNYFVTIIMSYKIYYSEFLPSLPYSEINLFPFVKFFKVKYLYLYLISLFIYKYLSISYYKFNQKITNRYNNFIIKLISSFDILHEIILLLSIYSDILNYRQETCKTVFTSGNFMTCLWNNILPDNKNYKISFLQIFLDKKRLIGSIAIKELFYFFIGL